MCELFHLKCKVRHEKSFDQIYFEFSNLNRQALQQLQLIAIALLRRIKPSKAAAAIRLVRVRCYK